MFSQRRHLVLWELAPALVTSSASVLVPEFYNRNGFSSTLSTVPLHTFENRRNSPLPACERWASTMHTGEATVCAAVRLSHSYGKRAALVDISFTLPQGAVTGLVGANGSGKSTLLRILSGVQRPTSGAVFLFGEDLASSEAAGRGLGAAAGPGQSLSVAKRYRLLQRHTIKKKHQNN